MPSCAEPRTVLWSVPLVPRILVHNLEAAATYTSDVPSLSLTMTSFIKNRPGTMSNPETPILVFLIILTSVLSFEM